MSRWSTVWERLLGRDRIEARTLHAAGSVPTCSACAYFLNDPAEMEAALPGLSGLSSAFGSVRSDDGLCIRHDRFVTAASTCTVFRRRDSSEQRGRPPIRR